MSNIFKSPQTSAVAILIVLIAFVGSKLGVDNDLIKYVLGLLGGGMLFIAKDPNSK